MNKFTQLRRARFLAPAAAFAKQHRVRILAPAVAALAMSAGSAHAVVFAGIDVGPVVETLVGGVVLISAIGTAGLSLVVVIKLFKWVRSAI